MELFLIFIFFSSLFTLLVLLIDKIQNKNSKFSLMRRNCALSESNKIYRAQIVLLEKIASERLQFIIKLQEELATYKVRQAPCYDSECKGVLVPLPSIKRKLCSCCKIEWPWDLNPGQKSTFVEGLTYANEVHAKAELVQLGCTINPDYEIGKVNKE